MFGESINIETMQEKLSETIKVTTERIAVIFSDIFYNRKTCV